MWYLVFLNLERHITIYNNATYASSNLLLTPSLVIVKILILIWLPHEFVARFLSILIIWVLFALFSVVLCPKLRTFCLGGVRAVFRPEGTRFQASTWASTDASSAGGHPDTPGATGHWYSTECPGQIGRVDRVVNRPQRPWSGRPTTDQSFSSMQEYHSCQRAWIHRYLSPRCPW